jgi:hypothetical protein
MHTLKLSKKKKFWKEIVYLLPLHYLTSSFALFKPGKLLTLISMVTLITTVTDVKMGPIMGPIISQAWV